MSDYVPPFVHPYMPNSAPDTFRSMLDAIGKTDISELFDAVPEHLRSGHKRLPLPEPFLAEADLNKHIRAKLKRNKHTDDFICFLGGGVAKYYVPAVCDELVRRPEFYTSFMGRPASDPGKMQVQWEYQSMLGDLCEMEITGWTTHCGATAGYSAILLCARVNHGRHDAVVAGNLSPDRRSTIHQVCRGRLNMIYVDMDVATGLLDMDDYATKVGDSTAVVYFENPSYLGGIEHRGAEIAAYGHEKGALVAVSVNPITLGLLETPRNYGADVICGDAQPLGVHLQYGGGNCGFLCAPDEERFAAEYPYVAVSATPTAVAGEQGYCLPNYSTTSWYKREEAGDINSTNSELWTVPVGAYLAQMGPQGMREIGELIISNTHYAKRRFAEIEGITLPLKASPFMEVLVNFDEAGLTVKDVNRALYERGILGGHDVSEEYPWFGQSALYCFTDLTTKDDIDTLVDALREVV